MSAYSTLEDLDAIAETYAADRDASADERAARRLRDATIQRMLPMADRLARRYRFGSEPADDVAQVARLGLVKAVERYDPERGSFTAYAVSVITGEIKRHFRDTGWNVHVPRRLQELALAVGRAKQDLTAELGRWPTEAELAARCGVDREDMRAALVSGAGYRAVSLSQPTGDGTAELGDLFGSPDRDIDLVPDRVSLADLLDRMPQRERHLLTMRFQGNHTQQEIGDELGISQMHVSRLLSRALGWLREALLTDAVPPWPGENDEPGMLQVIPELGGRARVIGEIDRDNTARLRAGVQPLLARTHAGSRLTLDLSRVPLLDAAGAGTLLTLRRAAAGRDVRLELTGMQPHVRQVASALLLR
ncbi:sigma-70 family RNA polymerase sigma factor [Paractinoplanes atraurantiacus]|uniref:RNA polymerase sigma-B factor n=1 Tax=Paractinoplanes atraurantiacus TaxID=1036182 RepID=A0A285KCZ6_9ACTN|nr:sigma-70 family RNA polymerase sigma factor [Actinoplanes atraurantiacus]SNY70475.1 RNA polymerase sigma-B factor [Actinoplanes atraurantiacus]